jgi:hypothetical protein
MHRRRNLSTSVCSSTKLNNLARVHQKNLPFTEVIFPVAAHEELANDVFAAIGRPLNADLIFGAVTFPFHQLVSFIGPPMVA